jgi:hypothetical protein
MMNSERRLTLVLSAIVVLAATASIKAHAQIPKAQETPVEVLQVLELPITINGTVLVKRKDGYFLKCLLSNSSESRQLGLRYSLAAVDSMNVIRTIISNTERITLDRFSTEQLTFKTRITLQPNTDQHFVLMLEEVTSTDHFWEVAKAKELLAAYVTGDYSITPRVVRLPNHIDAPIRVIY